MRKEFLGGIEFLSSSFYRLIESEEFQPCYSLLAWKFLSELREQDFVLGTTRSMKGVSVFALGLRLRCLWGQGEEKEERKHFSLRSRLTSLILTEHTARKTTGQRNWVTFYSFTWMRENLPLVWRRRICSRRRIA